MDAVPTVPLYISIQSSPLPVRFAGTLSNNFDSTIQQHTTLYVCPTCFVLSRTYTSVFHQRLIRVETSHGN